MVLFLTFLLVLFLISTEGERVIYLQPTVVGV
jgi:hypothetical protein